MEELTNGETSMGGGFPARITLVRVDKPTIREALGKLVPAELASSCPVSADDDQWIAWAVSQIRRAREYASDAACDIERSLTPLAAACSRNELRMFGGWKHERAYEAVLRLLCWGDGVLNFMPENEENTFFVLYSPAQLQIAFGRICEALATRRKFKDDSSQRAFPVSQGGRDRDSKQAGDESLAQDKRTFEQRQEGYRALNKVYAALGPDVVDKDNVNELNRILDFLTGSVLCGADTAILFSDPP